MASTVKPSRVLVRVAEISRLSDSVLRVRFLCPSEYSWKAGQHLALSEEEDGEPSYYSIASADARLSQEPAEPGQFELAMNEASVKFRENLQVGQELFASSPAGGPAVEKLRAAKHVYLVGMGTGVAPLRALVQSLLQGERPHESVTLVQGARNEESCLFYDEFISLRQKGLNYIPVLSQPGKSWQGLIGRVQSCLNNTPVEMSEYCVCGSKEMVDDVSQSLKIRGLSEGCLFAEGY